MTHATFALHEETHTMGNALRWMLMKKYAYFLEICCFGADSSISPAVEFCGYRFVLAIYDAHCYLTSYLAHRIHLSL